MKRYEGNVPDIDKSAKVAYYKDLSVELAKDGAKSALCAFVGSVASGVIREIIRDK